MRALITVISFLSVFLIVGVLIPYEFSVDVEGKLANVPDYFAVSDILLYNVSESVSFTLNKSLLLEPFEFGGHSLAISSLIETRIMLHHYFWWAFIRHDYHAFTWYNSAQQIVSDINLRLQTATLDAHDYGEIYRVECDHMYFTVLFGYNETLYSSHTHAFDNEALMIWMGIDFDQRGTSLSAWNLVTMLLTFQMPDIHWSINMMLAIPFWACIAYLVYVLIIKMIPFVAGG